MEGLILEDLRHYLNSQYEDIFDQESIEAHIRDYVGYTFADQMSQAVASQIPYGANLLDIGSGFGAFVISANRLGLNAVGLELASYDIKYARRRLYQDLPENKCNLFNQGDGCHLPFLDGVFDAVTLWNVLEHIFDVEMVLSEAKRVLKPGGLLFIICPNYLAFRHEAHYQVFWPSLLPRKLAVLYLRVLGKNPAYFETSIFYRTNLEIISILKKENMIIRNLGSDIERPIIDFSSLILKISRPEEIKSPLFRLILNLIKSLHLEKTLPLMIKILSILRSIVAWKNYILHLAKLYNPFISSVVLSARKRM